MLVHLVIKKYLPFNFFDDEDTQNVFHYLRREAEIPKRMQMKSIIVKRFEETQKVVFAILRENTSKLSFTIDGWTSINGKSYYGITGHFLSEDWVLHSLVIDFVASQGSHTGKAIADLFYTVLEENGLTEKFQGITVDNAASNTTFVNQLAILINDKFKTNLNPLDIHFLCWAHVLNLAAQDFIRSLDVDNDVEESDVDDCEQEVDCGENEEFEETQACDKKAMWKIRTLFKKLKFSEQLRLKLENCCNTFNIKMESPKMDVSTRWFSTHDLISSALRMKEPLNLLCISNCKLKHLQLNESEWELLKLSVVYLLNFKILSKTLSGDKYITLPSVIVGFNILLDKLEASIKKLEKKKGKTVVEIKLHSALLAAWNKLLKHYRKTNWIYGIVLILDPRHKIKCFKKTVWGKEIEEGAVPKFEEILKQSYADETNVLSDTTDKDNEDFDDSDFEDVIDNTNIIDFNSYYDSAKKSSKTSWREELDKYLESTCADNETDIAKWWKGNREIYPTLHRMARDFLSIQATSVPSERLFSRAGLTIRKHRNRLTNDSARTCMCLNSWLNCSLTSSICARLNSSN